MGWSLGIATEPAQGSARLSVSCGRVGPAGGARAAQGTGPRSLRGGPAGYRDSRPPCLGGIWEQLGGCGGKK